MKKHFYFQLILFFCAIAVSAQSQEPNTGTVPILEDKPTSLVLKVGLGNPISDYGNDDINTSEAGLAQPSLLIEGALEHYVSKSTYITFMGRHNINGLNESAFTDLYRSVVPANVNINFSSKPWTLNSIMFGLGNKIRLDDKINLITRYMFGYTSANSPSFTATLSDGRQTVIEQQTSGSGGTISYLIGAGLSMQVSNGIKIQAAADYFTVTPEISDVNFKGTSNGNVVIDNSFSFTQKIRLINLSVNLAIAI